MGAAASTDTLPDNLTEAEVRAFVGEENYQQDLFAANSVDNKMAKDKLIDLLRVPAVRILHFNDVYNIEAGARDPVGGISRFVTKMNELKESSVEPTIVLFGGDAFNPSLMSTVTKGEHMVPCLEAAGVEVAVIGNHDLDFGVENLKHQIKSTSFPWLISNVKFKPTGRNLADGLSFHVKCVGGRQIGFIGLVESAWMQTLSTINECDIDYEDFVSCGKRMSTMLRQPPHNCEAIIAITHMRVPNDEKLARECGNVGEIDLIVAGHDHHYDVKPIGENAIFVCKSGTDFRDITSLKFEFGDDRAIVTKAERVVIDSTIAEDPACKAIVETYQNLLGTSMEKILGYSSVDLDARFSAIRTSETNIGNFIADVLRRGCNSDVAILNAGTIRADCILPAGVFKIKDLSALLPMLDDLCSIEMKGFQLLEALENGVSQYPALEGRWPATSGCEFEFDPLKDPHKRITDGSVKIGGEALDMLKTYSVATKAYLAKGKDGYDVMAGCKELMDAEDASNLQTMIHNVFTELKILNNMSRKMKHLVLKMADKWRSQTFHKNEHEVAEGELKMYKYCIQPKVEGRIVNLIPDVTLRFD